MELWQQVPAEEAAVALDQLSEVVGNRGLAPRRGKWSTAAAAPWHAAASPWNAAAAPWVRSDPRDPCQTSYEKTTLDGEINSVCGTIRYERAL